jgi:HAD superfamily hydrolase (TIGR01490 family)
VAEQAARAMAGRDEAAFRELLERWVHDEVVRHVAHGARLAIERRRADGYVCAVLTGSTTYTAEPLAATLGIEHVIASTLEVENGRFTGRSIKPLCYGKGKLSRAEAWAGQLGVDLKRSAFYTDSISDLPMLLRVGEPRVVNPDPRLRLAAWRRGWQIERW